MKNIVIFLLILFTPVIASGQIQAVWTPEWQFNKMDDSVSCSVFSDKFFFFTRYSTQRAYIGIQEDNSVTIHTTKGVFSSDYISKFGIRVGKNKAVYHPKYISPHMVRFSPEKSKLIIEQLVTSTSLTLQVAFAFESDVVDSTRGIGENYTTFNAALASKNTCVAIKDGKDWPGIGVQDMTPEATYIKFIEDNTDYSNAGVIIWSVHPKKAGRKSGLLNFDIIIAVNKKPVELKTLDNLLYELQPGNSVDLNILRGNSFKDIKLTKPK